MADRLNEAAADLAAHWGCSHEEALAILRREIVGHAGRFEVRYQSVPKRDPWVWVDAAIVVVLVALLAALAALYLL